MFNQHNCNLMMTEKLATPGLLKIKLFWNKGYGGKIYVHDITQKFYHVTYICYRCGHLTKAW